MNPREPAPKPDVPAAFTLVDRLDMAATTAYGADSALCDEAVAELRRLQVENDAIKADMRETDDFAMKLEVERDALRERLAATEAVAKRLYELLPHMPRFNKMTDAESQVLETLSDG